MKRSKNRCPCGKATFSSYDKAMRLAHRIHADRAYYCPRGGGWHITSATREEFDRRRAEYEGNDSE